MRKVMTAQTVPLHDDPEFTAFVAGMPRGSQVQLLQRRIACRIRRIWFWGQRAMSRLLHTYDINISIKVPCPIHWKHHDPPGVSDYITLWGIETLMDRYRDESIVRDRSLRR